MFRTIQAKFTTTCKRCKGTIALGQRMRYGGRGRTFHLRADCPAVNPGGAPVAADDDARALADEHRHQPIISNEEEQLAREVGGGYEVAHGC